MCCSVLLLRAFVAHVHVHAAFLILSRIVAADLNHDENQFIVPGALFLDHGLLPYKDYPFFHVPLLTFVYAALYKISSYKMLAARLFGGACSVLVVCAVLA